MSRTQKTDVTSRCLAQIGNNKRQSLFNSVLKMDFPDSYEIGKCLYRRNNIVHRYGLANTDRMQVCNAKKDDVYKLLYACQRLVSELKSLL